jgi:hypothetical protein
MTSVAGPVSINKPAAACVIVAWLAGWTILGAWPMMTRDACDVTGWRASWPGRPGLNPWRR